MGNRKHGDLENPQNWDFDRAEEHPPAKSARAVVSVAFARDDLDRVSEFARQSGMKLSEYIREAALSRGNRRAGLAIYSISTSSKGLIRDNFTRSDAGEVFVRREVITG